MKCKVSVIMATWNAAQYLKENIESILNQTYQDFEFIIVDDASTDQSAEIIASYQDPRIVYLRNEKNLGQTASLNKAIHIARGEYIARMDADDVCYPNRLQRQVKHLDAHPEVGVVGSWSVDMDAKGKILRAFKVPTDPLKVKCFVAASGDLSYWCISHPTVMIRKSVLNQVGLYNEEEGKGQGYPQDYELWERIARKYDFAIIPEILIKYRIVEKSDSRHYFDKYRNHRWEISQRRIHYYLPDLILSDFEILLHMLEYRPQPTKGGEQKVFALFDQYMKVYLGDSFTWEQAKPIVDLMKLYYIPQLIVTNPFLGLKEAVKIFFAYPAYLIDLKFYRKLIKTFCQITMSPEQYKELCKKTL